MKKKLSILLMSSVIAVSLAGCQTDTSSNSSVSSAPESSSSTSLSSDEASVDESDTSAVEGESSESSDNSLEESSSKISAEEYISVLISSATLSTEKWKLKSIDLSEPIVFTITSSDEMDKFYEEYKDTYSLDDVESNLTFSEIIDTVYSDAYFDGNDIIIIIQKYDTDDDIEINEVYIEDSKLKINVYKNEPSSDEKTGYNCSFVGISKDERGSAEPVIVQNGPMTIVYETDEESTSSTVSAASSEQNEA